MCPDGVRGLFERMGEDHIDEICEDLERDRTALDKENKARFCIIK